MTSGAVAHLSEPFPVLIESLISDHKYATLKVSTAFQDHPHVTRRELKVYEHLSNVVVHSKHPGPGLIRALYDTFEVEGPSGQHQCLVQQPMHMSIIDMMRKGGGKLFPVPLAKAFFKRIVEALDFLHSEAEVVHTGTQFSPR